MADNNPPPEFIILDSNVIVADYWLRSPSFVLLREFLKKTGAKLVVPRVVFEEVINHHREELEAVKSDMQNAHRKSTRLLRNFSQKAGQITAVDRNSARDPYDKFLRRELRGMGTQIIEYKDIPHEDVMARDLRRARPFQQSGKGYRDTLLWETIIRNCIKKGAGTVFVTNNTKDFCDAKGELHEDLRKDIREKGANETDFKLFKDLIQFTDALVVPLLKARKDFVTLIVNKKVPGLDLERVCDDNLDVIIEAIEKSPSSMIDDPGTFEPSVDVVYVPNEFEIVSASEVSSDTLLIVFKFRASVAFMYFLSHNDYFTISEEESQKIRVLDPDWNESVMRVGTTCEIDLKCRLTFDTANEEVESFEVEEVEGVREEY